MTRSVYRAVRPDDTHSHIAGWELRRRDPGEDAEHVLGCGMSEGEATSCAERLNDMTPTKMWSCVVHWTAKRWMSRRRQSLCDTSGATRFQSETRLIILAADEVAARATAVRWFSDAIAGPGACIEFGSGRLDAVPGSIEMDQGDGGIWIAAIPAKVVVL